MIRVAAAVASLALLLSGTAVAAGEAVDGAPVPTGDAASDDAIEAYLRDLPPATPSGAGFDDYVPYVEPRTHRELGFAIGTGGYRSVYGRQVSPIGKSGTLDVAVEHTRFAGRYGRGSATGLSVALDFTRRDPCRRADDRPWRRNKDAGACKSSAGAEDYGR